MGGKKGLTIENRFMNLVNKTDSCWLWKGKLPSHGYGLFSINKRTYRAHRVSYSLFVGIIPDGLLVCHKCDVTSCVNPDHLFVGTDAVNMADRDSKGRVAHNRGEKCGKCKVPESVILKIKCLYKNGVRQCDIARDLGLTRQYVNNIVHGISWSHVEVV